MAQTAAERRKAQRATAKAVQKGGASPIAGMAAKAKSSAQGAATKAANRHAQEQEASLLQQQLFRSNPGAAQAAPYHTLYNSLMRGGYTDQKPSYPKTEAGGQNLLRHTLRSGMLAGALEQNGNTMWDFGTNPAPAPKMSMGGWGDMRPSKKAKVGTRIDNAVTRIGNKTGEFAKAGFTLAVGAMVQGQRRRGQPNPYGRRGSGYAGHTAETLRTLTGAP
jgi:hypothetical protein